MNDHPLRVLFLCTGNSARSQMAEALLRHASRGAVEVSSAGSQPRAEIHPMARRAMQDLYGLDMAGQRPKPLEDFIGRRFDYVIAVCDVAAESCPIFPEAPEVIHWSFEDPAAAEGADEEKQRVFERTAKDLMGRIRLWLSLSNVSRRVRSAAVDDAG